MAEAADDPDLLAPLLPGGETIEAVCAQLPGIRRRDLSPSTRLVHAWSYLLWFRWRPYIDYRSRVGILANEPGAGGRKWRRIGTPY